MHMHIGQLILHSVAKKMHNKRDYGVKRSTFGADELPHGQSSLQAWGTICIGERHNFLEFLLTEISPKYNLHPPTSGIATDFSHLNGKMSHVLSAPHPG